MKQPAELKLEPGDMIGNKLPSITLCNVVRRDDAFSAMIWTSRGEMRHIMSKMPRCVTLQSAPLYHERRDMSEVSESW